MPSKEVSLLWAGANRAGSRTPMQWNNDINAGFSTVSKDKLYLPVDPDYALLNVAAEQNNPDALLNLTKNLLS